MTKATMIYVPGEVLTVVIGNQPVTVQAAHPNFSACVTAAKADDLSLFATLANIPAAIAKYSQGKIEVNVGSGMILYNGQELNTYLCDVILRMMEEGFQVTNLITFLENLMDNPSFRALTELYGFLEHGKMPITPDGHFLAYKRVRSDYRSVYDGKTDNSIGQVVEMARNMVDEDSDRTCSYGLHFCSIDYLRSYSGAKIIILKINPRDVVAIPTDYNNTKGRACRYEVVGELTELEFQNAIQGIPKWKTVVVSDYEDRDTEIPAEVKVAEPVDSIFADLDDNQKQMVLDYQAGYRLGYKDGRGKKPYDSEALNGWRDDLAQGYKDGYKDGKAHKPKKVK